MEDKKEWNNIPITSLTYWPDKEFEIIGFISGSTSRYGKHWTLHKDMNLIYNKQETRSTSFTFNPCTDIDIIDAIIDFKKYQYDDIYYWSGTAIKFK